MRERLSSKGTFFIKRILPLFYLAFFAVWMSGVVIAGLQGFRQAWWMAAAGLVFIVLFVFLQWSLMRRYADEVVLDGDWLMVRHRGSEERILLSNIVNVGISGSVKPARITLQLRNPCRFGDRIVFFPRMEWNLNPFARNETSEMLIQHVDRARQMEYSK